MIEGLPADGATRVLVAHGGVDVLDPDPTKPSLIRLAGVEDALARGAIHYVALGDKHSLTDVGSTGRVWYSGSPEVTNYDDVEADPGHVLIVDIDEADPQHRVTVESARLGRWRFSTLNRQVDTSRDIADLDLNLDLMPDKDRTVLRLALIGSMTVTDRAALDACLDKYLAAVRVVAGMGQSQRSGGDPGRRGIQRPGYRRFRRRSGRGVGGGRTRRRRQHGGRRTGGTGAVVAADRPRSAGPGCGMKLHRLVLKNYRGIEYREIEFPDHGVVVVSGANEIGKSSMVEALDLLLESKDRSTKKEVKQVKPTHADVGSEITAEISAGAYRFIYHKRFHKRPETQLTVSSRVANSTAATRHTTACRPCWPRPWTPNCGMPKGFCSQRRRTR